MTAPLTDADIAAMEERLGVDPASWWAARGEVVDAAFSAHAREDVPRLLAELRRLRRMLRDYASACDVIDAPQPPESAEALDAALSAHDAARDALYAEGKR